MKVLTATQARDLQRRSAAGGTGWAMQSSGRKWGCSRGALEGPKF